jgi:hypothetical protein
MSLNNNGGGIYVDGARSITSTVAGGKIEVNQYKRVSNNSGTGTLTLDANVTVNLNTNGNFDFGKSGSTYITTLNGTLSINSTTNCFVNTNPPIYGSASLLKYNSGGTSYGRGVEWSTTSGAGFPNDIQVTNNTTLDVPNTGGAFSTNLALARDLTIDSGSALYMDYGAGAASGSLTVGRNVNIAGALSLGDTVGGDMNVAGNWTRTGTFTHNGRLVTFNGTTAQTLTGATTFDYLKLNNSLGLTLNNDVVNNLTLNLTNGKITLGTNNLTIGASGTIINYSDASYIVTNSTGQLKRTVAMPNSDFPVGNATYSPVITNNVGTTDVYGIRVVDGAITTGANNTKTVSKRWFITENVAGGSDLSFVGQYNGAEVNSGYNAATDPFIGFYNGTTWTQVDAILVGSDPFTANSEANTQPTDLTTGTQYFAIGKDNGFLSVPYGYRVDTITPTSPTAGSAFSAKVTALDKYGAVTTISSNSSFNLTTNGNAGAISGTTSGTILSGTNSVTVTGIILPTAGTGVTLTATNSTGLSLAAGTSATFNVLEKADHLAFAGVPATGNVGVNLASFTVRALRPDNTLDDTYTGTITIARLTGSGVLSGTLSVSAVAGVATFSAAQFDAADTYTLTTTSGSLTSAASGNIVVSLLPIALGTYPFTGTASASGPPARLVASAVVSNVSFSSYGKNTLTINTASGADDNVFSVQPSAGTYGTAINTSLYEEFTVTPNLGYFLNLDSITFSIQRTGAGATNYAVRSSQDNYGADISTGSISTSYVTKSVTLSGTSNGAVTYRIYFYGGSNTGFVRIDDVTLKGNVICIKPTAYTVTGGGAVCSGTGVPVGLSNSQLGINYQLQIDGVDSGSAVSGTGAAISFGNQNTVGTYTVIAKNTNGTCNLSTTMTGSVSIVSGIVTTWKITSPATTPAWDNGAPNSATYQKSAIIEADYAEIADLIACSLVVTNNANVTIPTGKNITLNGALTVNAGSTFTLENDANLVQVTQATNTGDITVKREITIKDNKQYNYLISPTGSGLKTDLYGTGNSAPFTLYHNEANNTFGNSSGAYIRGRGLAVKEPATGSGTVTALFKGVPMNEAFSFALANSNVGAGTTLGYNLTGNPYPSNIDLNKLYNLGTNKTNISATFYFWDNTVNAATTQGGTGYNGAAYAVFNAVAGSTGTGLGAGSLSGSVTGTKVPTRVVKTGQGFMVQSIEKVNNTLEFDNTIRISDANPVFFGKGEAVQDDRFWLNLSAPTNITKQVAIVYFEAGLNEFAKDDSELKGLPSDVLYTVIGDKKAVINGRAPFVNTDQIPLGANSFAAGTYTFSLGTQEGIFANGQSIYLKDNQAGTVTNLSEGNYTFTANAGETTGRFEIVYEPQITLATDGTSKEELMVYKDSGDFVVTAKTKKITSLEAYDMNGRLILKLIPNSTKVVLEGNHLNNGVYILKINQGSKITTKKVIR